MISAVVFAILLVTCGIPGWPLSSLNRLTFCGIPVGNQRFTSTNTAEVLTQCTLRYVLFISLLASYFLLRYQLIGNKDVYSSVSKRVVGDVLGC